MNQSVLLYCPDEDKAEKIKLVSSGVNAEVRELAYGDLVRTVGDIAANKNSSSPGVKVPPLYQMPEVMIFSGFMDGTLDRFLAAYKKAHISPIGLKAVVTPFNLQWTLYDLIEHLKEERASMGHK